MADEQSINIPQLVIVLVLGGLAIKYLFFTTPAASSARPRGATMSALVGVIMGSKSDWSTLSHTADMLEKLGIPRLQSLIIRCHAYIAQR